MFIWEAISDRDAKYFGARLPRPGSLDVISRLNVHLFIYLLWFIRRPNTVTPVHLWGIPQTWVKVSVLDNLSCNTAAGAIGVPEVLVSSIIASIIQVLCQTVGWGSHQLVGLSLSKSSQTDKPVMEEDVAGNRSVSSGSPVSLTSVTCTQCGLALDTNHICQFWPRPAAGPTGGVWFWQFGMQQLVKGSQWISTSRSTCHNGPVWGTAGHRHFNW